MHDLKKLSDRMKALNEKFNGKKIVITGMHEREGQYCDFMQMHLHATADKGWLTMEVKAQDGVILELDPKHVFLLQ